MAVPIELTDGLLLDVFHPVAKALSGLTIAEHWDVQLFVHKGFVMHVTQVMEGGVYCHHCQSRQCSACLYLLAKEVRS
jgi:hypothetical protein